MKISSIILAGGKNLRLGRCKALEAINGKSLLERIAERLRALSNEIIIVTSQEQRDLPIPSKTKIILDLYPDSGPLGGLYTGLVSVESSYSIVVACDMPFLNTELLSYMVELSSSFDAVVPRLGEGALEPLHAVYSKDCLDSIKGQLERGKRRVSLFLDAVNVRYVEQKECRRFDPQLLSFFNINNQLDLERAITLATNQGEQGALSKT